MYYFSNSLRKNCASFLSDRSAFSVSHWRLFCDPAAPNKPENS